MHIRRSALLLAIGIISCSSAVFAAADGSPLELPKGAKVAIVVFESLEAPDCAAVVAQYSDSLSPSLGPEFRSFVFQYQTRINANNLRAAAERFAVDHKLMLPAEVDASGRLKAQVQADIDLGKRIRLE
jgi:hypothetical protein